MAVPAFPEKQGNSVQGLERLVLFPGMVEGNVADILGRLYDGRNRAYRYAPDLGGGKYLVNTERRGTLTVYDNDGEHDVWAYAALYEVRRMTVEDGRVYFDVMEVRDEGRKKELFRKFMNYYSD